MKSGKGNIVKFEVHRFDPQQERHYVSGYDVPVRKGMTVLDALMYIKDNLDETLVFRHSCRMVRPSPPEEPARPDKIQKSRI